MSPKEIIEKLLERDSYETLIWLQFLANKMSCNTCVQTRKQQSGNPPHCHKCIPAAGLIKKHFGKGVM